MLKHISNSSTDGLDQALAARGKRAAGRRFRTLPTNFNTQQRWLSSCNPQAPLSHIVKAPDDPVSDPSYPRVCVFC